MVPLIQPTAEWDMLLPPLLTSLVVLGMRFSGLRGDGSDACASTEGLEHRTTC